MDISFRPAKAEDLPGIVAMLADDELGRQREDPSNPLNPKYLESFASIEGDTTHKPNNQFKTEIATTAPEAPLNRSPIPIELNPTAPRETMSRMK